MYKAVRAYWYDVWYPRRIQFYQGIEDFIAIAIILRAKCNGRDKKKTVNSSSCDNKNCIVIVDMVRSSSICRGFWFFGWIKKIWKISEEYDKISCLSQIECVFSCLNTYNGVKTIEIFIDIWYTST